MKNEYENEKFKESVEKIDLSRMTSSMINIGEMIKETATKIFGMEGESVTEMVKLVLWAYFEGVPIYFAAEGRSALKGAWSFAMRLTHLGILCFITGPLGITTPWMRDKALVIAVSGSGKTSSNIDVCQHVREEAEKRDLEIEIIIITANGKSPLASYGDLVIVLPEKKQFIESCNSYLKRQLTEQPIPLGDFFENIVSIFLDVVVVELMHVTGITEEEMERRHVRNKKFIKI